MSKQSELNTSIARLYRVFDFLDQATIGRFSALGGYQQTHATADALRLASNKLQRIAESECNGTERWDVQAKMRIASWTEADQARADKARAKAEYNARHALGLLFGEDIMRDRLSVSFQNDTRGAMITLSIVESDGCRRDVGFW